MAIDKNSKSMLDPNRDGNNFGIAFTPEEYPTNAAQCMESCNTASQINRLVGKVSYKGANQSQLPSIGNGGNDLGRPGTGTGE